MLWSTLSITTDWQVLPTPQRKHPLKACLKCLRACLLLALWSSVSGGKFGRTGCRQFILKLFLSVIYGWAYVTPDTSIQIPSEGDVDGSFTVLLTKDRKDLSRVAWTKCAKWVRAHKNDSWEVYLQIEDSGDAGQFCGTWAVLSTHAHPTKSAWKHRAAFPPHSNTALRGSSLIKTTPKYWSYLLSWLNCSSGPDEHCKASQFICLTK